MKKLLVWDGDECLWTGTLQDGDVPALPRGRAALVRTLTERGVLQAVASFNRHRDVLDTLNRLDLADHFVMVCAELRGSKSAFIRTIMDALELARAEDVVFLDDQPFNRHEVEAALPGVYVDSPENIIAVIQDYFTKPSYTEEDRARVRMVQENLQRVSAQTAYEGDHREFLRDCGIELIVDAPTPSQFPRVADLFRRANRMSAVSPTLGGVPALEIALRRGRVLALFVRDRYGDYGLSGLVVLRRYSDRDELDALVLSCRLRGRGIGSAVLGSLLNRCPGRFEALYRETEYNQGMRDLYRWYGFDESGGEGAARFVWEGERVELPSWVSVDWRAKRSGEDRLGVRRRRGVAK